MKTRILFFACAFCLLAALASFPARLPAQAAQKIGFVDIDQVTEKAKFVKSMLGNLESSIGARQKSLEAKQDEYSKLRSQLAEKASASESEVDALRKQMKELQNQMDEETFQINRQLKKAESEQMGPAIDRILAVCKKIGAQDGYDLIVRGDMILFGSSAVDLTQKVIDTLDKEYEGGDTGASEPVKDEQAKDEPAKAEAPAAATPAAAAAAPKPAKAAAVPPAKSPAPKPTARRKR